MSTASRLNSRARSGATGILSRPADGCRDGSDARNAAHRAEARTVRLSANRLSGAAADSQARAGLNRRVADYTSKWIASE